MQRFFRRVRPATSAADALPLLAAFALALQLLLPLWHATELPAQASCAEKSVCALDDHAALTGEIDCEAAKPWTPSRDEPAQPDHDPRTCPTCQWLAFVKTFTAPTLLPPAEVVEANEWRLVDVTVDQVHTVRTPLAHSIRGPPSC